MMKSKLFCLITVFFFLTGAAADVVSDQTGLEAPVKLAADESTLVILGTNDIHGNFQNFTWLSGYVSALKAHVEKNYAKQGSVILLDAGDAAQGTLVSNHSEGEMAVQLMNQVGYTAAVMGNHGFDFGPLDWELDECFGKKNCNSLESVEKFVSEAKFPVLSANVTYQTSYLKAQAGDEFLPPYTIVPFQGRGVAIIGLENTATPSTTIRDNVRMLKFTNGHSEIEILANELKASGKADAFVVVMHDGGDLTGSLPSIVDAAVIGHTHEVQQATPGELPFVQSGANGEKFGLIQLVLKKDPMGKLVVVKNKSRWRAGIRILEKSHTWMGQKVTSDDKVEKIYAANRKEVAAFAKELLATTSRPLMRGIYKPGKYDQHRIADSEVGNFIAEAMLRGRGVEAAVINSGDIRQELPSLSKSQITFEDLFLTMPRNLFLLRAPKFPMKNLIEGLQLSVTSCKRRGVLQIAGFSIVFNRNCKAREDEKQEDNQAKLLRVVGDDGSVWFNNGKILKDSVDVVVTDFLALNGGAGFRSFVGVPYEDEMVSLRKTVIGELEKAERIEPDHYRPQRYINCESPDETDQPAPAAVIKQFCNGNN